MEIAEPARVSLTKYLRTHYRPDRHFLDGYLEKRNLGDWTHGSAQVALAGWCGDRRSDWNVRAAMSLRLRISPTRIRVCDFCLLSPDAPREPIPSTPPVLCIETISPKDRLAGTVSLCNDYLAMGVQNIWLIDPYEFAAYTYTPSGLLKAQDDALEIPNTPIHLHVPTFFASLD